MADQWSGYWKTKIGYAGENEILVRGYPIEELMGRISYVDAIVLALKGRFPSPEERTVLEGVSVALLDHGFISATVPPGRYVASANPSVSAGIAASVLSVGAFAVSPEDACDLINRAAQMHEDGMSIGEVAEVLVTEYLSSKRRIPGFGHPTHSEGDPRAIRLREIAEEAGLESRKLELYEAIHAEFVNQTGKTNIPINIDGMMAVVLDHFGYEPKEIAAIAIMSYMPGIVAHIIEEIREGKLLRIIPPSTSEYIGESRRSLPTDIASR